VRVTKEGGIFRRLRSRLKPAYFWLRWWLTSRLVERRLGIETSQRVRLAELGLEQGERGNYEPSSWLTLRLALPRSEVAESDVFIDLGSGMGRVVFQAAAQYQFRKVIGVELSPELHDIAERNVAANRHRLRCRDIELRCMDAREFQIPPDVTVVFFYNPFRGAIFAAVIDNILKSYDEHPRRLRVIYRTPEEHEFLLSTGRFRPVRTVPGLRPGREWSRTSSTRTYEVSPARHTAQPEGAA
jgi:SAM-dependent methyltransferase